MSNLYSLNCKDVSILADENNWKILDTIFEKCAEDSDIGLSYSKLIQTLDGYVKVDESLDYLEKEHFIVCGAVSGETYMNLTVMGVLKFVLAKQYNESS